MILYKINKLNEELKYYESKMLASKTIEEYDFYKGCLIGTRRIIKKLEEKESK